MRLGSEEPFTIFAGGFRYGANRVLSRSPRRVYHSMDRAEPRLRFSPDTSQSFRIRQIRLDKPCFSPQPLQSFNAMDKASRALSGILNQDQFRLDRARKIFGQPEAVP